jgi:hypothetical protein
MRTVSKASVINTIAAFTSALILVLASTLVLLICSGRVHADEAKITDFPLFVNCATGETKRLFYLSTLNGEGVAVYISPDRQAGFITASGIAQPVSGDASGDCGGKTLADLRNSGQAFDLKH